MQAAERRQHECDREAGSKTPACQHTPRHSDNQREEGPVRASAQAGRFERANTVMMPLWHHITRAENFLACLYAMPALVSLFK